MDEVIVACDDQKVFDIVESFGGRAQMTAKNHINGSSRIAEIASRIDADYIVNIQGDEPLIDAEIINNLVSHIEKSDDVLTLKYRITDESEIDNPNNVKVVTDIYDNAVFFSRSRIPFNRERYEKYYKHVGIYVYKKDFLLKYVNLKPTDLEVAESLEQLRILQNGYKIKVVETEKSLIGVDTENDLHIVRKLLR